MITAIIKILGLFLKKNWKLVLIVSLGLYVYMLLGNLKDEKDRANRNEENLQQLKDHPNNPIQTVTADEFKAMYADLLDSIKTNIDKKIKAKNITHVTTINEYYIDSTKNYYQAQPIIDSVGVFDISYKDNCWGFEGLFNINDSTTTISKKIFNNDINNVIYWKRKKWFNSKLRFMPDWFMKKNYTQETFDKCNSTFKTTTIDIVKRN